MAKLTRYSSFEELKSSSESNKIDSKEKNRRLLEYKAFIDLLKKNIVVKKKN